MGAQNACQNSPLGKMRPSPQRIDFSFHTARTQDQFIREADEKGVSREDRPLITEGLLTESAYASGQKATRKKPHIFARPAGRRNLRFMSNQAPGMLRSGKEC